MLTWTTVPFVVVIAVAIGYAVGKMPCWKAWQGYVGLLIVTLLVAVAGLDPLEAVVDGVGLAVGFASARTRLITSP